MRESDLEQDSALVRALAAERRARNRGDRGCPSPEALIAAAQAARGALPEPGLAAHLSICPDCASELALAAELRAWSEEVFAGAPALTSRWSWGAPKMWLPLAAGLLIGALGLAVFEQMRRDPDAGLRGTTAVSWEVEPRDQAVLPAAPRRLVWPEVAGADSYRVVVFDRESRPLWSSAELHATTLELPGELELRDGETYYWRVSARHALGEESSPLFGFTLAR
jgi:hypothetical protein